MGNCKPINLWKDPQVLGFDQLSQHSLASIEGLRDETISYLLDGQNKWDVQKIQSMFNSRITAKILKIRLGSNLRPDVWIQLGKKTENFNVKSVYCLIQTEKFQISHDANVLPKQQEHRWEPLQDEFLKLNVDGNLFSSGESMYWCQHS